eukprot:gb/GEZN01002826.1/.p1 GENE.gb/GEZN01002826.1/~~gb/GEZN01002826.1/.p1  ORF type:complete len:760 (+),score=168.42 gb/GEZN01002826.1/:232-2280(+)
MTPEYQKSRNCQKEVNYADACALPIIPIMATPSWKPTGWLGVMVAGALYTEFHDPGRFNDAVQGLLNEIRESAPEVFKVGAEAGKQTSELSSDEVHDRLMELQLPTYAKAFKDQGIDGTVLSGMTKDKLVSDLNVKSFHVDKIADAFGITADASKADKPEKKKEDWLSASSAAQLTTIWESKSPPGSGIDVEMKEPRKGDTALILAARRGDADAVTWLLNKGAKPDTLNNQGFTALMVTCMGGFKPVAEVLLQHKAGINLVADNEAGDTALSLCIYKNYTDLALLLLEKGANPMSVDKDDRDSRLHDAAMNKNEAIVRALLTKNANVNHQNNDGNAPLHTAAEYGAPQVVKVLMEAKADVTLRNKKGATAGRLSTDFACSEMLHKAVSTAKPDEIKKFLLETDPAKIDAFLSQHPNDLECYNEQGDTRLILAARAGETDIVKLLMNKYGANCNNPNNQNSSPLMASSMRDRQEVVQFLVERKANINQRTLKNDSPLSLATWKNHTFVIKCLIDNGANCAGLDNFGDSMLHDACKNGNVEITKYYISKNINVDHQNKEGFSPAHRAASFGQPETLKLLIEAKAKLDLVDNKGKTALDLAQASASGSADTAAGAARCVQLLESAKRAREMEELMSTMPKGAGGKDGGVGSIAPLIPLLAQIIQAMDRQTAEIKALRMEVAHLKK